MVLIEDNTIDGTLDISSRNISTRPERAHRQTCVISMLILKSNRILKNKHGIYTYVCIKQFIELNFQCCFQGDACFILFWFISEVLHYFNSEETLVIAIC